MNTHVRIHSHTKRARQKSSLSFTVLNWGNNRHCNESGQMLVIPPSEPQLMLRVPGKCTGVWFTAQHFQYYVCLQLYTFCLFFKKTPAVFSGFFFLKKLSKPKNQQGVKKCLHVKIFSIVGQVMAPWLTSIELGILHIVTSYSLSPVEALDNIEFLKKVK